MQSARNPLVPNAPQALVAQPPSQATLLPTLVSTRTGWALRLPDAEYVDVEVSGIGTIVGGAGYDTVTLLDGGDVTVSRIEKLHGHGDNFVRLGNFGNNMGIEGVSTVMGGMGYDRLTLLSGGEITVSGVEHVSGSDEFDSIQLLDRPNRLDVSDQVEQVIGGNFSDFIAVDPFNFDDIFAEGPARKPVGTYLYGGDGDDTLVGGMGEDTLAGGEGSNEIHAGNGDTVYIQSAHDKLYIDGEIVTLMVDGSLFDVFGSDLRFYQNAETGMTEAWTELGDTPVFTFYSPSDSALSLRVIGVGEDPTDKIYSFDPEIGWTL